MPSFDNTAFAWVVLAIVAGVIEISIPHFGMIFVSVGAAASAIAAGLGLSLVVQLVVFIAALAVSLVFLRPRMMARLGSRGVPSRTDTLIGREGVVTVDIETTVGSGRVNVGGEDWAARSTSPIATGARIRVVAADGIVLEVVPV